MTRPTIQRRRLRATLEQPVDVADGIGGTVRSFTAIATLWCALQPATGQERAEADRAEAAVSHRLIIRWRADVTAAMRFVAGTRIFAIRATFDPDGHQRDLVCLVEEVSP